MDLPITYARRTKSPRCLDCASGVQCVACRFSGRPDPRIEKYAGRLGDTLFAGTRGAKREEPED